MSSALAIPPQLAPDRFLLTEDGKGFEFVNGQLEEKPVSMLSSHVGAKVNRLVGDHAEPKLIGIVMQSDCTYQIFPDDPTKIRRPDGSLFLQSRVAANLFEDGHVTEAPDWVQETLSPSESAYDADAKVEDYLRAGVKLVWVINPAARTVVVHRLDGSIAKLREGDELTGGDLIPGFRCKVADLFPPRPAAK